MSIQTRFHQQFGKPGQAEFASPGRVNLIGEHIDYCGGLVMPMAIDRGTRAVAARNEDQVLRIFSERFQELEDVPLTAGEPVASWKDFPVGVVSILLPDYQLSGLDLYVCSDIGAGGLSSSASFSLLIAHALLWAAGHVITTTAQKLDLARRCQQVEHEFIGVNCGIMDQASIALGGIMTLDCGTLEFQAMPEGFGEHTLVVMDTCHPRTLASSKYNERVAELAEIKSELALERSIKHLCDIPIADLSTVMANLSSSILQRRLRHVVSENHRVLNAAKALKNKNFALFGQLMNESHQSLQQDYDVTGPALDRIVSLSQKQTGSVGARMTGAGFGGCALALVKTLNVAEHNQAVMLAFEQETGVKPNLFTVAPANPAGLR